MTPEEVRQQIDGMSETQKEKCVRNFKSILRAGHVSTGKKWKDAVQQTIDTFFDDELYQKLRGEDRRDADYYRTVFYDRKPTIDEYLIAAMNKEMNAGEAVEG